MSSILLHRNYDLCSIPLSLTLWFIIISLRDTKSVPLHLTPMCYPLLYALPSRIIRKNILSQHSTWILHLFTCRKHCLNKYSICSKRNQRLNHSSWKGIDHYFHQQKMNLLQIFRAWIQPLFEITRHDFQFVTNTIIFIKRLWMNPNSISTKDALVSLTHHNT